jgi:transketolase
LSVYDLSIEDLKKFRSLHSKTAGHPEYRETPGVETTTGPLGQGLANAVGMAWAEKHLAARFNKDNFKLVNHYTWVFVGDGCLMEGISHEAASLAGLWKLGQLIVFYDDNGISIDGDVSAWFGDNTPERFEAYGWQVLRDVDGHDPIAIDIAIDQAKNETTRPTLICCKTSIGHGAPHKEGGHDVHGSPLGSKEIEAMRQHLGWPYPEFDIPEHIYAFWNAEAQGHEDHTTWQNLWTDYQTAYPQESFLFKQLLLNEHNKQLNELFSEYFQQLQIQSLPIATRKASHNTLNAIAPSAEFLVGGSADLTPSNLTRWDHAKAFSADCPEGSYIHFGVREFGMAAIANGIQLHSGLKVFSATFLMFSEYARNAIRMAALMKIAPIFVFTHDSIGLGEDGPTHQPIEQAATLRMIPNLHVWRPADALETAVAWNEALISMHTPHALLLSRQNLAPLPTQDQRHHMIVRGGYTVHETLSYENYPDIILIATGSEVSIAIEAAHQLEHENNLSIRVVSMPCCEVFDQQEQNYRESILPNQSKKIAIEAGVTSGWWKYTGSDGLVLGIDQFGASAPADVLFDYFGLNAKHIVSNIQKFLGESSHDPISN